MNVQAAALRAAFKPQEVAALLWAEATLFRRMDGRMLTSDLPALLLEHAAAQAPRLHAFEFSNILSAAAQLGLARCEHVADDLTPQALTNVLAALAKLSARGVVAVPARLEQRLVARIRALLEEACPQRGFSPRGVARSLLAVGELQLDAGGEQGVAAGLLARYLVLVTGSPAAGRVAVRGDDGVAVRGDDGAPRRHGVVGHGALTDTAELLQGLARNARALGLPVEGAAATAEAVGRGAVAVPLGLSPLALQVPACVGVGVRAHVCVLECVSE